MASFIVDFAMSPEEAAHHPRIDVSGDERHRDRPPPAARRSATGWPPRPGARARRAHGVAVALRLPQPRAARRGRPQSRHHRRDVAVVGGGRRAWQASADLPVRASRMNDVAEAVEPGRRSSGARDAASLILLRGEGRDLELLAGRRPGHVRSCRASRCFPAARSTPRTARRGRSRPAASSCRRACGAAPAPRCARPGRRSGVLFGRRRRRRRAALRAGWPGRGGLCRGAASSRRSTA